MTTSFGKDLTGKEIREKVSNFYDLGSPLYLEVYGKHIHDGYYITGKETKQEAQENLTKLLIEKTGIQKGAKILDVGCGVGGSSIWLAEKYGATTVGITISPVQVDIARKLVKEKGVDSTFILMNAEEMHFDETFDVIWLLAAATHFRDQQKFIKLATKSLNKGGKFIIFDWMLDEHVTDPLNDQYIQTVADKMLLSTLYSLNTYLKWFIDNGYRIIYSEDVTAHTIKTWDDALSVIKQPAVLKLAARVTKKEVGEIFNFLKSIGAMKTAMKKGKLKAGIVIAEKLLIIDCLVSGLK
jgi:tocopherol O-methyltransferase